MLGIKAWLKKYLFITSKWCRDRYFVGVRKLWALLDVSKRVQIDPYGVDLLPYPYDWSQFFPSDKICLEIGSGHGELIVDRASKEKYTLFVGFEITTEFTTKSNKRLKNMHCENAIVFKAEGYRNSVHLFSPNTIDGIYILFPDPWHKKRHHKRRPLVEGWFRQIHKNLKKDGFILFATDWEEYFDFVSQEIEKASDLYSIEAGPFSPEGLGLPETHYYKKWKNMGREFNYILMKKW